MILILIAASCISFDSYIKPQLVKIIKCYIGVVYLLIPTSNHNESQEYKDRVAVVYLLIPTSNHNCLMLLIIGIEVVYLLIPTSNHNNAR